MDNYDEIRLTVLMMRYERMQDIDLRLVPYIDLLDTLLLAESSPMFTDEQQDARVWILERVGEEFKWRAMVN